MNKTMNYQDVIDKYYPAGSKLRDIYLKHSRSVADLAMSINRERTLGLDEKEVEAAAMLHDIGIFLTDASGIECRGTEPYLKHGYLGAELLRKEGVDEKYARVCERHTGTGLSREDIVASGIDLPLDRSYMPETLLERLVCYADKFYSKNGDMEKKSIERIEKSLAKFGSRAVERFRKLI